MRKLLILVAGVSLSAFMLTGPMAVSSAQAQDKKAVASKPAPGKCGVMKYFSLKTKKCESKG